MLRFLQKPSFCFLAVLILLSAFSTTHADLAEELKAKIDERNKVIAELEQEIALYQEQVDKTEAEAKTLKGKIAALELTRKKLTTEIKAIQNKISAANLTIEKLDSEIAHTKEKISQAHASLAEILQRTDMEESHSLVEVLLTYPSLSVFLDRIRTLSDLNESLQSTLVTLKSLKQDLESKHAEVQGKRKELVNLAGQLGDKKKVAEYNKAQTNKILAETKNKQSSYQKILDEKIALRNAFEQELLEFESQLKYAIDPTTLPSSGSGALAWPLARVKITQEFGDTAFARSGAYQGKGHNGIDFAAAVGTPVHAAADGIVVGLGDTDTACPGASYGRWALIQHGNGLSTLYAHLSVISVSSGETVAMGDRIGYSGETGYATGPHLHFTVYASSGVKVMSRPSRVCRATYTMPIASLNAYLNPVLYLK